MSKIIYHTGTGTYFGADDGTFLVDIDLDGLYRLEDTGEIDIDAYKATPVINKNIEELAAMFDANYYTIGTTGREAIRIAMEDMARYFSQADTDRDDDWLQNEDGTTATFVDVAQAIATMARNIEANGAMDKQVV